MMKRTISDFEISKKRSCFYQDFFKINSKFIKSPLQKISSYYFLHSLLTWYTYVIFFLLIVYVVMSHELLIKGNNSFKNMTIEAIIVEDL